MAKKIFDQFKKSWVFRQWDKIVFLIVIAVLILFGPISANIPLLHFASNNKLISRLFPYPTPIPALYPENKTGIYPGYEISASGVVVFDIESGVTLYSRNSEELLAPASTTKIMTALIALEHYQLDDVVTVQTVANSGAIMGLIPGEQITVENLLYGALIQSGNDAAWAIAEHFEGGVPAFVQAMNDKALALHLLHTSFTNPVGYDDPNHKTSAMDLTRLSAYALTHRTIAKIVGIPQITISDITHTKFHSLTNINTLLGKIPGVAGIKTGWTEEAGENLVTLIERDGHRIITVVLKSRNRFADTEALIHWVFANYEWKIFDPNNAN